MSKEDFTKEQLEYFWQLASDKACVEAPLMWSDPSQLELDRLAHRYYAQYIGEYV